MSDLIQLDSLPVETLAEMANEAAAACEASGRKTVEHAIRCGRALLAIRPQIPHGEWLGWLKENFHQTQQRAHQYMEIANYNRGCNLEDATSIREALRLIADSPEKRAKKAEREAKKLEAPPKPSAPATIRHESPPTPQPQPERPAWLADPDELERPEEDDLPPLPRTNTHHTADNRRTSDARETDRAGLVSPDDPRELEDGHWYRWDEAANRLFAVTNEQILQTAALLRVAETVVVAPATRPVVETVKSTKRFVKPTPEQVSAYAAEIGAIVDGQQFCDFYESKDWMIGKNKMKDWRAAVRTWSRSGKKPSPAQLRSQAAGTEDFGIEYEVVE